MNKNIRLTESTLFIVRMIDKVLDFISTKNQKLRLQDLNVMEIGSGPDKADVKVSFRTSQGGQIFKGNVEMNLTKITGSWHLRVGPMMLQLSPETGSSWVYLNVHVKDDRFDCYPRDLERFRTIFHL